VNTKIWHLTEKVLNDSLSLEEVGRAAKGAEAANAERRKLIKEVNDFFSVSAEKFSGDEKI
jgi:hypothetical protein